LQVFKDIIEVFRVTSVESIDQADSVYTEISTVFRTFEIDISGLIPESEFHSLPSFGIIDTAKKDENVVKNKGVGYSYGSGVGDQDQKVGGSAIIPTSIIPSSFSPGLPHLLFCLLFWPFLFNHSALSMCSSLLGVLCPSFSALLIFLHFTALYSLRSIFVL
jgi:hypothetical protein